MDAYSAVIILHNLGFQLAALEGDKVAICPAVNEEHTGLIRAIRNEPQEACKAIQCLPQLCVAFFPGFLKEYAFDLFGAMKGNEQVQIVSILYAKQTGDTEWVFIPTNYVAHRTMLEILDYEWGVIYLECKEEGQRWGA